MTYDEYKRQSALLYAALDAASESSRQFPREPNGLTPDAVKFSAPYREAKRAYDLAFAQLRDFNGRYVRVFKKEIQAERAARYA